MPGFCHSLLATASRDNNQSHHRDHLGRAAFSHSTRKHSPSSDYHGKVAFSRSARHHQGREALSRSSRIGVEWGSVLRPSWTLRAMEVATATWKFQRALRAATRWHWQATAPPAATRWGLRGFLALSPSALASCLALVAPGQTALCSGGWSRPCIALNP